MCNGKLAVGAQAQWSNEQWVQYLLPNPCSALLKWENIQNNCGQLITTNYQNKDLKQKFTN